MDYKQIEQLKHKRLCYKCIGEAYLKDKVKSTGKRGKCSYCKKVRPQIRLEEMAKIVAKAFEDHYYRTSDQPDGLQWMMMKDDELNYEWEREGEPVVEAISNAAEIGDEPASDVQQVLEDEYGDIESAQMGEETEFADDSYYEQGRPRGREWHSEWRNFERTLKTQTRYFSQSAAAHLSALFDGIETMPTKAGRPIIVDAGPQSALTHFYRARTFQADEKVEGAIQRPDREIGPPPAAFAGSGRMNARGISVFYGAGTPETALAEVRPPVGSKVVVAKFDLLRPLRLLDLGALPDIEIVGSIFDPTLAPRQERAVFLRTLKSIITVPVMPDDEGMEYIVTQAIADFLATQEKPAIDGILFPSVQVAHDDTNVVLFHKSARVEDLGLPAGSEISSSGLETDSDGAYYNYTVFETVPKGDEDQTKKTGLAGPRSGIDVWGHDDDGGWREPTLKIDLDSVEVRMVQGVTFSTENHKVQRHRIESRELAEKLKKEQDDMPF